MTRPMAKKCWLGVVVCLAFLGLLCLLKDAEAHSNGDMVYDKDCCNNLDCLPVLRIAHDGDDVILFTAHEFGPLRVPKTWWEEAHSKWDGRERIRPSTDGRYHACAFNINGAVFIRCIYVPGLS